MRSINKDITPRSGMRRASNADLSRAGMSIINPTSFTPTSLSPTGRIKRIAFQSIEAEMSLRTTVFNP